MPDAKRYQFRCQGGVADIYLYQEIDRFWGIGAQQVVDDLKAAGNVQLIRPRINSEGGSFFEGVAIYNLLRTHPARIEVYVDGMALSIASLVAMAGDQIIMAENAYMMIHDPTGSVVNGDIDEFRSMAEILDKITQTLAETYAKRTGLPVDQILELMADETWFTATGALEAGFADQINPPMQLAAHVDSSRFHHVPGALTRQALSIVPETLSNLGAISMSDSKSTDTNSVQPATYQELKAAFPKAPSEFLTGQLDREATLEQARSAYQADLETKAQEAEKRAQDAEARAKEIETKAKNREGVDPLPTASSKDGSSGQDSGDARERFSAAVAAKMRAGTPRREAVLAVARGDKCLHEAYLRATNSQGSKIQQLIGERFALEKAGR